MSEILLKSKVHGRCLVAVYDRKFHWSKKRKELDTEWRLRGEEWYKNLVTTSGLNAIRDMVLGFAHWPTSIGISTNGDAVVAATADLPDEILRIEIDRRTRPSDGVMRVQALLLDTQANGNTLRKAGLFNSPSLGGGTLFSAFTHDDVTKTSGVIVTYTWEWTFS